MVVQLDKWATRKVDAWERRLSGWEQKFSSRLQQLEADRGRLQISEELCAELEDLRCQLVVMEDDCSMRDLRLQELECDLGIENQRLQYATRKGAAKRASTNEFGERVADYFARLETRLGLEIEIHSPAEPDAEQLNRDGPNDQLQSLGLSDVRVIFRLRQPKRESKYGSTSPFRSGRSHGRSGMSPRSSKVEEKVCSITLRLSAAGNTGGPAVQVLRVQPELHVEFVSSLAKAVNTGTMSLAKFIVAVRKAFVMKYMPLSDAR